MLLRVLRQPLQAAYSSSTPILSLRRWIYNPTLIPPLTTGPALQEQFRETSAPHLAHDDFKDMVHRDTRSDWGGLLVSPKKVKAWTGSPREEIWASMSKNYRPEFAPPSTRFTGRSIQVRGDGVGAAWNKLQAVLRQNNVRRELKLTQRHEKKGVKRRRLRSERWKRKFADEVRKKVVLVNKIRLRDRMWGSTRR